MTKIKKTLLHIRRTFPLYLMMLPGALYLLINNYFPLSGLVVAFKDYDYGKGIWGSSWAGLQNFEFLFKNSTAWVITRNTILYNLLFIALNTVIGVCIAVLLNEIRNRTALKIYQTVILLPYLFSMIIISYLVFAFLSSDSGLLNKGILQAVGAPPISWYTEAKYWPVILPIVNTWKAFGFQSIIFFASVVAVDDSYFEAAQLDGAGKLQQIWYITLPFLKPVVVMMTLLAVGKIFYSDFGLFYQVTQNSGAIFSTTNTIDTYVYRALTQMGDVGMASAAGVYQSIVGFILVLLVNLAVKKLSPEDALF